MSLSRALYLDDRRRLAAESAAFGPLADSLAADLDRLLPDEDVFVPIEKAKLTRRGGRCPREGELLLFDPMSPRQHVCPRCSGAYDETEHYLWWVMGYQLWLAERAVHAAVLWSLRGNERHKRLAASILRGLADRYPAWPDSDNVLGPGRPFFSTYLESIWLLQLAVALDLLEATDGRSALGEHVRDVLIEPSVRLIASFDEGLSNRQVWHNAALAAAGALIEREDIVQAAFMGGSGLSAHLERGLLSDGTWYEGENYHLFAHRGLWYLMTLAAARGVELPQPLVRRFGEGFATPFITALPDLTMPARRDSPYGVSLRQWRVAESCELGLAREQVDERLAWALATIYDDTVSPGDTARWRSTAEAERNAPAVRLTRADLGWKTLLFGREELPAAVTRAPESALLEGQGLGILRRDRGRLYVALDFGHSGGGHGHPDRLNLWLVDGDRRVLQDVGTGSYVDPSLHWYRSTLAHNAPLVDGRSQDRVHGRLLAWEERDACGWIAAAARLARDVDVRRDVVVMSEYLVDRLSWRAERVTQVDLPFHVEADLTAPSWTPARLQGGPGREDGFAFAERSECAGAIPEALLRAPGATAHIISRGDNEWWRAQAPGPPGTPSRRFHLLRCRARAGEIIGVWTWREAVRAVAADGEYLRVMLRDSTVHVHQRRDRRWTVTTGTGSSARRVVMQARDEPAVKRVERPRRETAATLGVMPSLSLPPAEPGELTRWSTAGGQHAPLRIHLARDHYRRSEQTWKEAGAPEALIAIGAASERVFVEVSVRKLDCFFVAARTTNPLDNEHPDVDSDGVQLYAAGMEPDGTTRHYSWLLVPDPDSEDVRVTSRIREGPDVNVAARWRPTPQGYQMLVAIPRIAFGGAGAASRAIDVIVNEKPRNRERRRGQLVMSGGRDEWIYLRGDRHDRDRYMAFEFADD